MRAAVNQKVRINILRLSALALVPAVLVIQPMLGLEGFGHETIESLGILLLLAGVLGRFWSILYVGGLKNRVVMQDGPYSMTRNPLYFFSTVAATGIGLMFGAVGFALMIGGTVGVILWLTARREAAFLSQEFGPEYDAYAARTPFFLPDPRLFRTGRVNSFDASTLRRNLFDAFVFLSFIPLVEMVDQLKLYLHWSLISLW
ncbi:MULTISPECIES: methyltransferase family protein [unclassified Paracoccus (in: a-proteobacteria)]|uniref:methyltransferase family protein n=1 Tax=unclassified Paracoccus (in: a-proteobacteria) TaxID=2688777 RepID=UPI0012B28DB9|nr:MULTISPECIES: isoprenylcysteine carboxylmethyltransferase family protein [unclassified Paracoccus (in: a-proteobacteria)]UXU76065.1 isoprenylcysteine carboxylmethyltransferase family protein [Paracoccus sp. SMMA_5]UXU81977.1 isoprenylcysteine carboxylmethyltransferase family protein [Paracoccus sp. SMMA_5_TC]